mmetsp:Transcript_108581/g.338507  ORF Transcript_108581/g.338507 Transcript_108581/m.338507 type:complete len:177 (-) Transcript_108581:38-568(-)
MPFWSTVEFNSMRLVAGAMREPHDDLESLGYLMCHGLFGELPWFDIVRSGPSWEEARDEACERARESKHQLLCGLWSALGLEWAHFMNMPKELGKFLLTCACRKGGEEGGLPDYPALAALLGEGAGEAEDRELLRQVLQHLKVQYRPHTVVLPQPYAHLAKEVVPRGLRAGMFSSA